MDKINVCFICDENYALPTLTAIQSIGKNKMKETKINLYIIGVNLTDDTIEDFNSFNFKNIQLFVKNIDNRFDYINTTHQHVSKAALLKFDLPNLFTDLDKILYLDGDMLILSDLSELFNTDISNFYAAVVSDMRGYFSGCATRLGLDNYFNSGMMLLNLDKMRKENIVKKLQCNKENQNNNYFMDQDAFNLSFQEKVFLLSPKWNLMKVNMHSFSNREIANFYNISEEKVDYIFQNPAILHLTNKLKPWKTRLAENYNLWNFYFHELADGFQKRKYEKDNKKLIISLTSYPARITNVCRVIDNLRNQSILPDEIILSLGEDKFPNKEQDLPNELIKLKEEFLLTINWIDHDYGPFMKLLPTLKKYPDALIITIDDDAIYQNNIVERLLKSYVQKPNMIHTLRAHGITFEGKKVASYKKWIWEMKNAKPSYNNFLTGVGGVLYPPNVLHPDVFDENKFKILTPKNDDIWFWAMAVHNCTEINLVTNNGNSYTLNQEAQDTALWKNNVIDRGNDKQFLAVLAAYPDVIKKIYESYPKYKQKIKYKLFNFIPLMKIKKNVNKMKVKLFGFLPIFSYKQKGGRTQYNVLGLPVFKIRRMENGIITKYYILNIPVMKVSRKECR